VVNRRLAESYYRRALTRLEILEIYLQKGDYPDVIRETQEVVELFQKAVLIHLGVDPPKWHDVGDLLLEYMDSYPPPWRERLPSLVQEGKWLRSQREVAFYGEMDLIPESLYKEEDARRAIRIASAYGELARDLLGKGYP
jgi:HEPN domain-containing protein